MDAATDSDSFLSFKQRQLSAFALPPMAVVVGISQGFAAVTNIIIFVVMYWSLRPVRYPDMLLPEGVVDNIVVLCVGRGLGLAVIQLAYFGTFVAAPGKPYWIAFQMVSRFFIASTPLLANSNWSLLSIKLAVQYAQLREIESMRAIALAHQNRNLQTRALVKPHHSLASCSALRHPSPAESPTHHHNIYKLYQAIGRHIALHPEDAAGFPSFSPTVPPSLQSDQKDLYKVDGTLPNTSMAVMAYQI
ncbi:hypothetical protein BDR05DRAFT_1005263 [Suillus weaverae]|nr:hypothetical protein BDR05DRAFT_1005263 [Suillus weaverae]